MRLIAKNNINTKLLHSLVNIAFTAGKEYMITGWRNSENLNNIEAWVSCNLNTSIAVPSHLLKEIFNVIED